ncbi:beta-ketoacyl synthase chain length factor [Gramella sp. MAR_2010_147]|uniref:beta-ketoacyl synthase chain length factor n=1 Tax=Gramella sp. MAR_2010_147 TaxID=1250205 RepID=UPI000879F098|nr:beta-ketoacyl synthase chain length factor [Gramella sp. MAR_2010_147]SDR77436.1 Beta-ketoacyl synthase, N-terminal domain [Gramella sp. MAR_2010_147]
MHRAYINGISSISPQYENIFEDGNLTEYEENIMPAIEVDYKSQIKPMMLRRMSKAVKMGLFCSKKALLEAGVELPDAIIVGTGQGCLQDTEKFMMNMLDSEEGLLSPTSFIQSTHNTVAGQIALDLKCKGYNMTFTQNAVSFESALIDGLLQLEDENIKHVLVGGVDEISNKFTGFQRLDAQIKTENINNLELLSSETSGTIISESAAFFSLSSEITDNSYCELKDAAILNSLEVSNITQEIDRFLKRNNTSVSEIDVVVLGNNGDARFDHYYKELQDSIFSDKCHVAYKHLIGENNSVSSYALILASRILKEKKISDIFKLNTLNCANPRNILIYNQYLGKNHGLILLQSL